MNLCGSQYNTAEHADVYKRHRGLWDCGRAACKCCWSWFAAYGVGTPWYRCGHSKQTSRAGCASVQTHAGVSVDVFCGGKLCSYIVAANPSSRYTDRSLSVYPSRWTFFVTAKQHHFIAIFFCGKHAKR